MSAQVIDLPRRPGKHKCPQCSHLRKNKTDKPLSVHYDGGKLFYRCHHCEYKGQVESGYSQTRRVSYTKPSFKPADGPNEKLLAWFQSRCIPADIVKRHRIESREVRFAEVTKRAIAFPYYRGGELVNVKYRSAEKNFKMETGAELTFYGMDDIDPACVLVVEGEIDKLTCEFAGFKSCISVPNGAGTNLDILANVEHLLDPVKKFIIAGDNDIKGEELQAKLIRRLGPERCWRVEWPEGCKDANEALMTYGLEAVREAIEWARPLPVEGAFEFKDLLPDLVRLYNEGRPRGLNPGWENVREFYKPRLGQWTVITGTPNAGKSSFCRALLVNLATLHDWQFVVFPPEDCPPEEYWSLLLELKTNQPFDDGPTPRMDWETVLEASQWVDKHFVILNPKDGERDFDSLIEKGKAFILRRGINGIVIDPWNRVEHFRPAGMTETDYVAASLDKFCTITKLYGLHNFIVAHPAKPRVDKTGEYVKTTLYDISGSAHWHNMSDFGIVLWRNKQDDTQPSEIQVQKVRSRWCGKLGVAELYHNRVTGVFTEYPRS